MIHITDGQCGLCQHFGEHDDSAKPQLVQLRTAKQADDEMAKVQLGCGHPQHEPLHLKVTPVSGCQGFTPAKSDEMH